jgi:uncharacterized surface protein with fasciclin (FAS1) repeats
VFALSLLASCNKDLPRAEPLPQPAITGISIAQVLQDPNYSILAAAVNRAAPATGSELIPLNALLRDSLNNTFTFFAPTNAAFARIGVSTVAALNNFRTGQLDTILRYHLVGGDRYTTNRIPETFPNIQLATAAVLRRVFDPTIATGLRLSIFPSRRGSNLWVNHIPIIQADIQAANGVIHRIDSVLLPPTTTLKGLIASNPDLTILQAAITRADSGQVEGLSRLDSVLNFAAANVTLFAPNNAAFRAMFPPGTPDANIIGALNTPSLFPAQNVRAIIAYHLLGTRAFSVNFSSTLTPYNTLLVIPGTPPVTVPVFAMLSGGIFTVKGIANPTPSNVFPGPNGRDRNAVNGVMHIIDQVLRPQ